MDLATHLKNLADAALAWVAEDPTNRCAAYPVQDVAFWNAQGIFTVEQFVRDGLICEFSDAYKAAYGFRPRGYDLSALTNEQIQKEISDFYAYARSNAEHESEMIAQWEAEQAAAEAEFKAENEWSKWQHYYDKLVGV
jgi:hypothetical protein